MLEPLVSSTSSYSSIIINIDLPKIALNTAIQSHEHSLVISVFDYDAVFKTKVALGLNRSKFYGYYLFATSSSNASEQLDRLLVFGFLYKFDNVGLVLINPNGTFQLSRITYDPKSVINIPDFHDKNCSIYDKMFHLKTLDSKIDDLYAYALIDPPDLIKLTSQNANGQEVISIGGRNAYIASLIPRKLNITLKLCTIDFLFETYNDKSENTALKVIMTDFLNELMLKTYIEDNREPKQLNYTSLRRPNDYT